ncbi:MAG: ATP-binding protein [Kiritimatiellae bacterium]|jgi:two-component system cell cycle sensor histidine kinase/response regulator CckA|nr:ATP-binding protein [Kiritimatiellia bacterium]
MKHNNDNLTNKKSFHEYLRALHSITNELSKADTLDDLFRRAIELGHEQLGFDRMSTWLVSNDEPYQVHGTFGIGEDGTLRDERNKSVNCKNGPMGEILSRKITYFHNKDNSLYNEYGKAIGKGETAVAGLWDGANVIGCMPIDNLLSGEPITEERIELLILYASTVGHLCSRLRALVDLRTSKKQYVELFNHMSSGVAVYEAVADGEDFVFKDFNRAGELIEKVKREDILGKCVTEVFPEIKNNGLLDVFRRVWRTDEAEHPPTVQYNNGQICSWRDYEVYKLPSGHVVTIYEDVSAQKKAEEERKQMEIQFQHAQKLESMGILAGGIAHDFNNILMAILGNADLALLDISEELPAHQNLKEIVSSSKRAADLCSQMLAYSGKGSFIIEPLNLSSIIKDMLPLLNISTFKNAELCLNLADDLPSVKGDATQIRQVIMNLVTNANEAIGTNQGTISITTEARHYNKTRLKNTYPNEYIADGNYVCLHVTDTGCGMDNKTLEKLFDPFFTTKFTGRGLGLASVIGIVRGHNGTIQVNSKQGKGTTFTIHFPAIIDKASNREQQIQQSDKWQTSGTVLVIDDEEHICKTLKYMLSTFGFDVITSHSGEEGLEIFRNNADKIIITLLDMTMPKMNGEQVFQEIKRIRKDACVILISGYAEQDVTSRFDNGLDGFIQKPFTRIELKHKLRETLKI